MYQEFLLEFMGQVKKYFWRFLYDLRTFMWLKRFCGDEKLFVDKFKIESFLLHKNAG